MYNSYIVKRTQIYLEDEQAVRLAKKAAAAGVTRSTLIRDAIDSLLDGPENDASRLSRFRSALEELAETPVSMPAGRDYVEKLRARDVRRQEAVERRRT